MEPWITFALVFLLDISYGVEFDWSTSQVGECVANDTSLGLCAKSASVHCIKKVDGQPVPERYCRKLSGSKKPPTLLPCDLKECRPRCVVSMWSTWNSCDPACVFPFKYRTRRVLWKTPRGVCSTLIERSPCARCSKRSKKEMFFWKIGEWGTCRRFTTITVHPFAVKTRVDAPPGHEFCGAALTLGKSTRIVRCVDGKGEKVKVRKCLNSKDKYGRITQRPEKSRVCRFPCDCRLSDWSAWSGCSKNCRVNNEKRTRDVLYAAQLGGKACATLEEIRACATKTCPRYEWYAAAWGLCQTQRFPGNSTQCGYGFQERLVFCVELSTNKSIGELQPVQDDQCDPRMKLISRKECFTPCPQDCKVSDWQPWQPCPVRCGKAAIKKRTRAVLQSARLGGKDCPNLVELLPCDRVQCYSWSVSPWSHCFTTAKCGPSGSRFRVVFCKTHNRTWVNEKECSRVVKPKSTASCSKPCPHDCAVSHWSEWGPCSKSCGVKGGIQTRHKKIMGYPNVGGVPCPGAKELVESKKCNQYTFCAADMTFMWKAEPWGMCEPLTNGSCGNNTKGIMKRNIHCVTHVQKLGNRSFCPLELKPADVQPCELLCPQDCILSKWQEWSVCSKMCSSTGVEIRKRYVQQEALHNGIPCPSNITDGVQTERRPCSTMSPCYTGRYQWLASEWKKCTLFLPTKSTQNKCGSGYKTRNISCLRSDQTLVKPSFCFKASFTAPPKSLEECWIPCPDSCVRSDWSNWSTCPDSCTTNSPNFRQRTRRVVSLSPGRGGFPTTCPQLTTIDISEKEKCPTIVCFSYKWHTGSWRSCILNDIYCCNGTKERAVLCQRSDKLFVSETYCSNATKPSLSQYCSGNCSQDCVVTSSWEKWSNCSNNCGDNTQTRHRNIVKSPVGYGRLCPSLMEKQLCHETPCSLFKWSSELWETCKINTNSTCGYGTQTRKVICLPDPAREFICVKQGPKPSTAQPCQLPCPGDCVLSNWGSWSECVKGRQGCLQKRWRTIIREASLTSSIKCDKNTTVQRPCNCHPARNLVVSGWTTCQLNHTSGPNCGKGLQFRSVKCIGEKGQILPDKYCTRINTMAVSQDCHVKCPVDCVLGEWSLWSVCSKTCGVDGMAMRSKKIIAVDENGGRRCPDKSFLKQKRPCNGKPCYTYMLKKGRWSKCYVDGQGCGYGMQTREAWCQRSDRKPVALYYCFEHLKRSADDTENHYLNVLQAVLNNISTLSISTKQKCEVPCPGDCVVSEWSEWSICGSSCFLLANKTFQTRSRVVISKPVTGGEACSSELQQTRKCQPRYNNNCTGTKWNTGPWQKNGTREVWCETSNGLHVSGACVINNKPSMTKLCDPKCSDPNAVCTDGKCICKPLFEFFQYRCIPLKGCLHTGHCVFKNTICKEQECKCREGHERNTTTEHCVSSPALNKPPIFHSKPSPTSIDEVKKKHVSEETKSGNWKWIGIGVGAFAFFMILIAVGGFYYTRRPQRRSKNKQDEKSQNPIELIGMLPITDGDQKPAKV